MSKIAESQTKKNINRIIKKSNLWSRKVKNEQQGQHQNQHHKGYNLAQNSDNISYNGIKTETEVKMDQVKQLKAEFLPSPL